MCRFFQIILLIFLLGFPAAAFAQRGSPGLPQARALPNCVQDVRPAMADEYGVRNVQAFKTASAWIHHLQTNTEEGYDPGIIAALFQASERTGTDFDLLLLKAILESDLGRVTVAQRSSARGVFQFIEPTWLILMHRYGMEAGFPNYAYKIRISARSGIPHLKGPDKALRHDILALRQDPFVAAYIKARQVQEDTDVLRAYKKGDAVTATDHYIAHMLGLRLAREFYDLLEKDSVLAVARLNMPEMREVANNL